MNTYIIEKNNLIMGYVEGENLVQAYTAMFNHPRANEFNDLELRKCDISIDVKAALKAVGEKYTKPNVKNVTYELMGVKKMINDKDGSPLLSFNRWETSKSGKTLFAGESWMSIDTFKKEF